MTHAETGGGAEIVVPKSHGRIPYVLKVGNLAWNSTYFIKPRERVCNYVLHMSYLYF